VSNEIKNSDSEIKEKKETKMKITTVAKASVLAATLGLACLLPAPARAQSDMSPDFFAFSADETPIAQPVQHAAVKPANADFEGKVSLPYAVNCGGQNLKAGQYVVSVKSEGTSRVVTIHGNDANVNMRMRPVPANRGAKQNVLLVRKSANGRTLEAVSLAGSSATLYLNTNANGNHSEMERLPIS
jgi:hypothetical protein